MAVMMTDEPAEHNELAVPAEHDEDTERDKHVWDGEPDEQAYPAELADLAEHAEHAEHADHAGLGLLVRAPEPHLVAVHDDCRLVEVTRLRV